MKINSVCTYCGVGCDITAEIEENHIQSIAALKEGVVSEGKLCIKGKYGFNFVDSPNRLKKVKIKNSFIQKNSIFFPVTIQKELKTYKVDDDGYIYPSLDLAYKIAAWKLSQIITLHGNFSFAAIGGARTSCENAYLFQKFTRKVMHSPHIDNCARVCHSPSLKGMRAVIGEGAATNPFNDIRESEFLIIIGSNTTEAHPIVANKVINAINKGTESAIFDVKDIALSKLAAYNCVLPYEANLLVLNMLSHVIISEKLYNKTFIAQRTRDFEVYKEEILNDPFANPDFFQKIRGYEYLSDMIRKVAREYASKKSMILWGLGITEHIDGSYAVTAICNLAAMTGNIGQEGAGLMPLRGQNNVQGACDMGCLPYYNPDYQHPLVEGLKTPDIINAVLKDEIKAIYNLGEDIAHIHPNQNKIHKALEKLEFLVVNELFDNEITKFADIIFGVKSAYEKTGVYVNAERRLHLSQPLVNTDLPDDWEVICGIAKELDSSLAYNSTRDIWEEVRVEVKNRFSGASYEKLENHRLEGLQWPVHETDTPRLHEKTFRTQDGLAHFKYKRYFLRGMVKELFENRFEGFYLTTARALPHYNNAAQTKVSEKLLKRHSEDILLVSPEDKETFDNMEKVVLKSRYGESAPLNIKFSKTLKKGTLFTTFHHSPSKINFLFGDECDELTKTAGFKSVKVSIEPI